MKLRLRLKHLTPAYYVRYVRGKSRHVQHIHAFVFAGTITTVLAIMILYTNYGFWHEQYVRASQEEVVSSTTVSLESPKQSFGNFLNEAKSRFNAIGTTGSLLLVATDTYER